jgi:3-carboxy-cis,cis-muconate cycloisomerase
LVTDCFGDAARIAAALAFERELAAALAEHGAISTDAAEAIRLACERFDATGLVEAAEHAGTLAIPLVERLRAAVGEHAGAVHLGATSQDVADTALVIMMTAAAPAVDRELAALGDALAASARTHARTPVIARTLLQPADVISLGVRFATWFRLVDDAQHRLARELDDARRVQLGGAVGTLAALGAIGPAVRATLAARLGVADAPTWHARRDAIAAVGCALANAVGASAKIARDISLLQGLGELAEPRVPGRGGSSAMPHKHNPTGSGVALAAAVRTLGLSATLVAALPQELERGLGGWQAEAPVIGELFALAESAARAMREVIAGLEVHPPAIAADAAALDAAARTIDELLTARGTRSRSRPGA